MSTPYQSALIQKVKDFYKTLTSTKCSAFVEEEVYFNRHGLNHLIAKQRKYRTPEEIERRYKLLAHVASVIKKAKKVVKEEKRIKGMSIAYFWTLRERVGNTTLRVILRRLNDGPLHFFSVMEENTKPPEGGL